MRTRITVLLAAAAVASGLAVAAPAAAAPAVTLTANPAATAAAVKVPKRTDGLNKPIYFVHGIQIGKKIPVSDCHSWDAAINRYKASGKVGTVRTVAYYQSDKNCNTRIASVVNQNTSIETLGKLLANNIYKNYSKKGIAVDAVGHSMGGLIIRAAITGVEKKTAGFPPKLFIEDVVTFDTPHTGTLVAKLCGFTECVQMRPGSALLKWLSKDPQSSVRTDWTLIGSKKDLVVPWNSAVSFSHGVGSLSVGHKVIFLSGTGLSHSSIYKETGNSGYKLQYWNSAQNSQGWVTKNNWVSPVVMARNGNFYCLKW
jgi:cytochrome c5